jgi:hypothetical protein
MTLKNTLAAFLSFVFISAAVIAPSVTLAAAAPGIVRELAPRVFIKSDGTADVLLRMTTNRPTEMQVMLCTGKTSELSGDPATCDWYVDTVRVRQHRMLIEDLDAHTVYSYRVQFVDAAGGGVTTERTFVTR